MFLPQTVPTSDEYLRSITTMTGSSNDASELPEDYIPSEYDVICGWARQNYHHGTCFNSPLRTLALIVISTHAIPSPLSLF
jgi:hypothetical protein